MHDRYDLAVRGCAESDVPIEEIVLMLDGAVIGRVNYGNLNDSAQRAFHLSVPLPRDQAQRACTLTMTATARSGNAHQESFNLSVNPAKAVALISGPTRPSEEYARSHPPVLLYVERAALDDGGQLLVHGWAVSLTSVVTVQVFLDEDRVGAALIGGQRDDVGTAFPVYANASTSGFTLSKRAHVLPESTSLVRVQAISLDGCLHEIVLPLERTRALPEQPATDSPASLASPASSQLSEPPVPEVTRPEPAHDPRREIRFFCDEVDLDASGDLRVAGWAVCGIGVASITLDLDGQEAGQADLGLLRTDVGEEYRDIPMARYSGFRFARRLGELPLGEHTLRIVLRNGLGDEETETRTIVIEAAAPSQAAAAPARFRLEIDTPAVTAGAAVEPVTSRLTIQGWALARSGISNIEVMIDDQPIGEAHYGLARQDVSAAFPDWEDSLRSGFAFHCPPRSLPNGDHVVQLNVCAKNGEVLKHRFDIQVRKPEELNDGVGIRRRITQVEADVSHDVLETLGHRPGFRLVLHQRGPLHAEHLLTTLSSLRMQVYRDWRLDILSSDADTAREIRALISESADDILERIDVIDPSGDLPFNNRDQTTLVGFLSPGDELGCDALMQIALASGLHRDADLLYADELRISPASRVREPFFKPDFSPDLLLSTNYIARPWFASTTLLRRCGLTPSGFLANGEYDAILRCTERAVRIHHVPRLLCARGAQQIDDADTEAAALMSAAARRGIDAEVEPGAIGGTWRFRRTQKPTGLVSVIIPTCAARRIVETCIRTLRQRTAYRHFEIICVENIPEKQRARKQWVQRNADKVLTMQDQFNWSYFNNRGAEIASGEYLLFLNDDIEVIQPDWLDAMLEHMQRPEVAVVGPQLLFPGNKVQHAGMFLGTQGIARHAFRFAAADEPGYFGLALTQRNVIAVTGACMLMRRSTYQALGGFEEAHQIINNDLDFCLRAHQAGKLVVYTPHATLVHHEAASRDHLADVFDFAQFEERWGTLFAAGDPYFNPNLSRHSDDYRPDDEPVETVFAAHPLFRRADVKRILVVKIDHIGDFVTAIPAIRRLKQIFPAASIHLLTTSAARSLAWLEDCIDEFIEFEFFHAVSSLGQKQISRDEYQALRDRLAPYRFDIAVDLRKHLDTREVLRYTGARILAGYDHMGQFPFLDIALEWEGDRNLQRKRSHVTDDLLNLVEAIGTAGMAERTKVELLKPEVGPPDFLSHRARALFDKPVVAVHPGVGNPMRQWPVSHFASLIDLLVEKNGVNVLLIGGPEEAELAQEILGAIANRHAVVSLVGRTPLRQLLDVLRACSLYVGNNSGPKHIAATLGVPTIGIHSGVVDAIEWGPVGGRAVAVRRNMACSPCYLARQEDCTRNFACMRGLEPGIVHAASEFFLARPVEQRAREPLAEPEALIIFPDASKVQTDPKSSTPKRRRNGQHIASVSAARLFPAKRGGPRVARAECGRYDR